MKSICVFGDSLAKGVIFDEVKQKYVFLKESCANLFEQSSGNSIRNYARFGCTITKGIDMLNKHINELSSYDYVALEFGGNDCDFDWAEVAGFPDKEHFPHVPLDIFEREYKRLIKEVRESGAVPVMLTLPPLEAKRFFDWVTAGLDSQKVLDWMGDIQYIYRWHELYNSTICHIAADEGVPLIDVRRGFLEQAHYGDFICRDGMHPNAKGHQLILDTLKAFSRSLAPNPA